MEKEKFLKEYLVERKGTNSLKWDALDVRYGNPDLTNLSKKSPTSTSEGWIDFLFDFY